MSQVHTIRLNGPWSATITSTKSGSNAVEKEYRFKMPHELPVWPADLGGHQLALQRKFNLPTSLGPEQQVWLAIDFLDSSSIGSAETDSRSAGISSFAVSLSINESPPLSLPYPERARIEIRHLLRPHNLVNLVCESIGDQAESAFALHSVCLEIL